MMRFSPTALLLAVLCASCESSPVTVERTWIAVAHADDAALNGLAVDAEGNSYLAGSVAGELRLGGEVVGQASSGQRAFVARLDADGRWSWVVLAGGDASSANGVAVDSGGRVYVVGDHGGSLRFGQQSSLTTGGRQLFVARIDDGGSVDWLVSSTSSDPVGSGYGHAVAVDPAGQIYIGGLFSRELTLGSTMTCSGVDYFVASLAADGGVRWAEAGGTSEWAVARAVALAPDDTLLVAGEFRGMLADGTPGAGETDAFVAQHRRGGGRVWSARVGGPGSDSARGVGADAAGEIWLTGGYDREASFGSTTLKAGGFNGYAARLSARGDVLAVEDAGGGWSGEGLDVAPTAQGALVAGRLTGDLRTAGTSLASSAGSGDGLLLRLDDNGVASALAVGGSGEDRATQVELAQDGSLRLGGGLSGQAEVAGLRVSAGRRGIFVWKQSSGLF